MNRRRDIIRDFTKRYIAHLSGLVTNGPRTYGFEYEFLPRQPFCPEDMDRVARLLPELGFVPEGAEFKADSGLRVNFEPGGQIEYISPPLSSADDAGFHGLIASVERTNAAIHERLGIEYIGVGYLPGRADAPLCLMNDRYVHLHHRLSRVGARGLEMMKGTASIHLHVVISNFHEVLPIFNTLCGLAVSDEFKMSPDRRCIWDQTDVDRCGIPPCCFETLPTPDALIERLIQYAVSAAVLGEDVPFDQSANPSFESFLYHMTTLFTDVRLNLKGPTLELRTLDSMPTNRFAFVWRRFIACLETI